MKRAIIAFVFAAGMVVTTADAAKPPVSSQPINIKSNELFTDTERRTATFVGKVSARQGDITIFSDKLVVYYKTDGNDMDRVEAIGNVRIVQENRLGTAGKAVYDGREGRIVLTENPKVFQGKDFVTGNVITYFVADGRSVVDGGDSNKQVEAVIHPGGKR